jgi:hypothetical protein
MTCPSFRHEILWLLWILSMEFNLGSEAFINYFVNEQLISEKFIELDHLIIFKNFLSHFILREISNAFLKHNWIIYMEPINFWLTGYWMTSDQNIGKLLVNNKIQIMMEKNFELCKYFFTLEIQFWNRKFC